jgi:uncharacterized protein with GYD domain
MVVSQSHCPQSSRVKVRAVKDSPKRSEAARELAKKVGVEIKHLYLTSGESDLVIFVDARSGDNVAKFALAVSSLGNVRLPPVLYLNVTYQQVYVVLPASTVK